MSFDFSACRVAIIGDVMLDAYIDGDVERISPEAPVPVLRSHGERYVPGGAANVAANVAALGGSVRLIAVIGEDANAIRLKSLLQPYGRIDTDSFVTDRTRRTTTKTRIVSGRQQIARIDHEDQHPVGQDIHQQLLDQADKAIGWADIVILSDYRKGVLTVPIIRAILDQARAAGKPTIVDPKHQDVSVYAGAGFITPNRTELQSATGLPCDSDEDITAAGRKMTALTGSAIIVTRSAQGMAYVAADEAPVFLPTFAREVFDVSGAGDTVVASLALGLAAGLPIAETMRLANHAAGIVVGKVGTAVVTAEELLQILRSEGHPKTHDKGALLSLEEAVRWRENWRDQGLTVGFTNGCFDLVHPGHVSLLEQAAAHCDRLIVGMNDDASVRRLKGPTRPVQTELARARVIGAMTVVDAVVLFAEDTPAETLTALKPDLLVKGADYTVDTVVGAQEVIAAGGKVLLADLVAGQSTTALLKKSVG